MTQFADDREHDKVNYQGIILINLGFHIKKPRNHNLGWNNIFIQRPGSR